MSFGTDLYTRLSTDVTLTGIVGNRIYPGQFDQQKGVPAIRYVRITGQRYHAMGVDVGIVTRRYQFDIIASTYAEADSASEALIASLSRWRDANIGLQASYVDDQSDDYESELELYRVRVDIIFHVEEQ